MFGDAHVPGVSEVGRRERTGDKLALELEAEDDVEAVRDRIRVDPDQRALDPIRGPVQRLRLNPSQEASERSEEHTSELQSQSNLVCRLLLEKTKDRSRTR